MNPTNTTATLNGHHGTLRVTIVGFEFSPCQRQALARRAVRGRCPLEFPDATNESGDWLVARIEWESRTARVCHEGPILLTTELDELAAAMAGASSARSRELRFIEPNFALTRSASTDCATSERVSIAILGEPHDGHEAFEARMTVSTPDVRAFGRALQRIATSLRAAAWRAVA
jgi:hypothetical protein